jgi:hypothetical protein
MPTHRTTPGKNGAGGSIVRDDTYTFRIDVFTPQTLPMARLAQYLSALADMMGEESSVHFKTLKKGSAQIVSTVEKQAAPKVRIRVQNAPTLDSPLDVLKNYRRIDEMLRLDNAKGELKLDGAKILEFPGRDISRAERIGPFTQPFERDGVLIRIGGADKTSHATIQDREGETWSFEITREIARSLCHYLFGAPVRLRGSARWARTEFGKWEYSSLRASEFVELADYPLTEIVDRTREIYRESALSEDPIGLLERMRSEEDEGGA